MRHWLAALLVGMVASAGSAQVIYAPVQHQYGDSNPYFYGGMDPYVHQVARHLEHCAPNFGRTGGYVFVSGNVHTHREVSQERVRVYTDCIPYREASLFGFTPNDAYNQANQSVPNYFRKSDLAYNAVLTADAVVVPSQPLPTGTIDIRPYSGPSTRPATQPAKQPTTAPRPILIIPKDLLEKKPSSDKQVAMAD